MPTDKRTFFLCAGITVTVTGSDIQEAGERYTLTCTVSGGAVGVNTSAYRWFRNKILQTGETSDTLSIAPLSQKIHTASYMCEATRNDSVFQSSSFIISVQSKFSAG